MSEKGFDKNTLIGLLLISGILLIFSYLNKSDEQLVKDKTTPESAQQITSEANVSEDNTITSDTLISSGSISTNDSLQQLQNQLQFGAFHQHAQGEPQHYVLENERMKVTLSNKGGRITSVELKNYHTYDSMPLFLFHEDSSRFNLELTLPGITGGNSIRTIHTEDLFFSSNDNSFTIGEDEEQSFAFRIYAESRDKYLEYKYTLSGNAYDISFDVNAVGLDRTIANHSVIYLNWDMFTPNQEKTIANQQQVSTVYYKYNNGDIDYIGETKYEKEDLEASVHWVMFKQQYFNSALIAKDKPFEKSDASIATIEIPEGSSKNYVQGMSANLTIPFDGAPQETFAMQYYFGPNKLSVLEEYEVGLENSINYGWGIFGWVNKMFILPIFNFLNEFGLSIGITILILTLVIKLILSPITWKTYLSSAKMRVLKPEITALNEKHKNDAMKKQQATMALYRQTGVNPLSGCIPLLIQMPILFALFRFFPATFDLRQKSFLWAEDLSTYDSVLDLPFNIPFYGDHVSLFTLMMAVSMIFYTKANSQMTSGAGMDGMMASQMKIMTYMMPIMMLFFFNSYAAGLSLYYLIANLITIGQQYAIKKWFIDEDKIHAQIQANKTKKKKKSGFAAKLEQRMKEAQELQQKRRK